MVPAMESAISHTNLFQQISQIAPSSVKIWKYLDPLTISQAIVVVWGQFFIRIDSIRMKVDFGHKTPDLAFLDLQISPFSSFLSSLRANFQNQGKHIYQWDLRKSKPGNNCEKIWTGIHGIHRKQKRISYDCNYHGKPASNSLCMHLFWSHKVQKR